MHLHSERCSGRAARAGVVHSVRHGVAILVRHSHAAECKAQAAAHFSTHTYNGAGGLLLAVIRVLIVVPELQLGVADPGRGRVDVAFPVACRALASVVAELANLDFQVRVRRGGCCKLVAF